MTRFEWDPFKEAANTEKHGVDFRLAAKVFLDPKIRIILDEKHSQFEMRMFAIGSVNGEILTVRFVCRGETIRIIGAGFWRKGEKLYETKRT